MGKTFEERVRNTFDNPKKSVHFGNFKFGLRAGEPIEHVIVYCKQCEYADGSLFQFQWRFVQHGGSIQVYTKGDFVDHAPLVSASQARVNKRLETAKMAKNPLPVSTQRRQMIGGERRHPSTVPSSSAVYAAQGSTNGTEHRPIPRLSSPSEWDALAQRLAPSPQ
eukprot:6648434-Pyramimonas_sp.AAC.1